MAAVEGGDEETPDAVWNGVRAREIVDRRVFSFLYLFFWFMINENHFRDGTRDVH